MRYDVTHTTGYEYTDLVSVSYHMLRLRPRELARQSCARHEVRIEPQPVLIKTRTDYFGNEISFVTIESPHRKLAVTSRSQVEVEPPPLRPPAATPPWEAVRELCRGDKPHVPVEACEFVYGSPLIRPRPEFAAYAQPSFRAGQPLLEAVLDLTARVHRDFKFSPKATTVATPLEQVFKTRRGVCQDFAQFEIACLRSLGLPARYVSGYLETQPPPGKPRLVGADASHAWVAVFCPDAGWLDVDPTNNSMPSTRHITVAWGRDYSDVSPVRGVLLGSGEHTLKVAVDVVPSAKTAESPEPAKATSTG